MKKGMWKEILGVILVLMIAIAIWQGYGGSPTAIADGAVAMLQSGADIFTSIWDAITPG